MHTWWERALIPFIYCRLAHLYPYALVNDPRSPVVAANGQYLLIRRDAYRRLAATRPSAERYSKTWRLARRARAQGVPLHLRSGGANRPRAYVHHVSGDVGRVDEEFVSAAENGRDKE